MKITVIAFTKKGGAVAKKICDGTGGKGFIISTHLIEGLNTFQSLHSVTHRAWQESDALVYVGAAGIAVRAIAPYVDDKARDRAVVVVDEMGKYAIPILSGHIGGANDLAREIAKITGGTAVITTATDINNKFSVDTFAVKNNLAIGDTKLIKEISARVLEDKKIGLYSDYELKNIPPIFTETADTGICISRENKKPFPITLNLYPKDVVIGIGCKKNCNTVEESLIDFMNEHHIKIDSVRALATIDIKKEEKGIVDLCRKYNVPLLTFTAKELEEARGDFSSSDFVKQTVGVDNVCERAVVKSGGQITHRKTTVNGTAIAAGTLNINIDFEE